MEWMLHSREQTLVGWHARASLQPLTTIDLGRRKLSPVLEAERTPVQRLTHQVASSLQAEAPKIAARWRTDAARVAPGAPVLPADTPQSAEIARALDALARGIMGERCWQDDLIRAGWALGAEEFRLGTSLHAVLKQLDLMEAMTLYAIETAAAADETATAADGIAVARRLQRARSLLSLATTKGFVEEYLEQTRARYRTLRHDIRNPLGTIKTAVSLMEDETIPADMRSSPRFRAMVKRNATSIDAMVGRRLADSVTREEAFAWHAVPLADVVRTVRRDLREEATEAHCDVVPGDGLPTVRTDALGAELLLRTVIGAVIRDAAPHTDVRVELSAVEEAAVVLMVRHQPGRGRAADFESGLALAERLARKMSGRVWRDDAVFVALPTSPLVEEGKDVGGAS